MKKAILAVLSLLLVVSMLSIPLVVSASSAVETVFDPATTQWYSVDFVRTSAADAKEDAYVYTWTPSADGNFTLEADTDSKDTLVTFKNLTDSSAKSLTLKYYPAGGFTSADGVTCKVVGGNKYEVSVMTCSEKSGEVSFFAYYESVSSTGLKGAGTLSDPYILDGSIKNLPSAKKGQTIYYLLSAEKTKKFDLTVKGKDSKDSFDLYVENNSTTVKSSGGAAKAEFVSPFTASGYILFSIKNNNNGAGGGYSYKLTEAVVSDTKGTFDDPEALSLNARINAKITDVCYYYTYTATEDGSLIVTVYNKDNWVCAISGGEAESLYCTASDSPVVNPLEYAVKEGEEITLWVATESFGAGNVEFDAIFVTNEGTTATEAETFVPATKVTEATEATEATEVLPTTATEPLETEVAATTTVEDDVNPTELPDSAETTAALMPDDPAETTAAAVTEATEPTESEPATTEAVSSDETFEELYDGYCLSTRPVTLGENEVFTSKDFDATLFEFYPDETGFYKISADDNNALVGAYVGSVNYIFPTVTGESNEVTLEFSAGNEIIIGLKGVDSCTLKIERVGDIEVKEETPWTVYENTADISKFDANLNAEGLKSVFTYDKVANSAVFGDDGYYHLDSQQGEILYVDLNSKLMSLVGVVDRGRLCAVFYDENGNVTEKIDYTPAVLEYIENAKQVVKGDDVLYLYPLTADLIEMYQIVGATSDWYGRTGWVGGLVEDAWMFACVYEEGSQGSLVIPLPPAVPTNPSTVPTGRSFTVVYVALALMAGASLVFVISRRKVK